MTWQQIMVVDDFYPDPDTVRDLVLNMPREEQSGGNYAGVMTQEALFTPGHQQALMNLTGQQLTPSTGLCGKVRFTQAHESGRQHIHFDPGNNMMWAGVVFLQQPEHYPAANRSGTRFWRHLRTGLSSIPLTQEGIEAHGWNNVEDLQAFLETDGVDESLWELTLEVPYRYNRLVLFRPWQFHSPGDAFGDSLDNCRILQTLFLTTEST